MNLFKKPLFFIGSVICLVGCQSNEQKTNTTKVVIAQPKDLHTQSNADSIVFQHLNLDIKVDFLQKQISGLAEWKIYNKNNLSILKLDTYDLTIDSVLLDGQKASFQLDSFVEHLGKALKIPVKSESKIVQIWYRTGSHPRALQWLNPQQTGGNSNPFLYTQSESIYARSWIPTPDGPGIRFTYDARVAVPKNLMALMSAENPQQMNDSGVYHFKMATPIPAYLMALAVGDIRFQAIDNRTGVYAMPNMIDKAAWELADIGKMVHTAEKLYGPYRWGRYDVLILPPGFPIGGMENPKLTFATPTIISGDKSLVNLIAHELAHNWSGNLVTNATWNDFWLNEGFTVYFERRLTEAMTDKSYADMLWELGYQDLETTVKDIGPTHPDTHLKLDLSHRDPDDGLTDIAYEKGALFLRLIELKVGRPKMDDFLKNYFSEHAFKTMTTEVFLIYLADKLFQNDTIKLKELRINDWVYGPGIPSNAPHADRVRFASVDQQRIQFLSGVKASDLKVSNWTTHEWLHFLRLLPKPLGVDKMLALDQQFHFTNSQNSEIADLWFVLAVAADYKPAFKAMEQFLNHVGRRKFLTPLYEEMMQTNHQEMAKRIYQASRNNYHSIAQTTLDKIILNPTK